MNTFQIFACVVIILVFVLMICKFMFRNYGVPCPKCAEFETNTWEEDSSVVVEQYEDSDEDITDSEEEQDGEEKESPEKEESAWDEE